MNNPSTLWIDLDPSWDENWLNALFATAPGFQTVKVIRDRETQVSVGYGFVEFDSHDNAKSILEAWNGQPIPGMGGRQLKLNWGERRG